MASCMVDIVSIIMEASATDLNARIAERVRELRAQRGLSLDALARKSGVSRSMISLIERGESSPTAVVLEKLAAGIHPFLRGKSDLLFKPYYWSLGQSEYATDILFRDSSVLKEIYPARVFDLLVGDPEGRRRDRSILDDVMDDAKDLQRRIAAADSKKLDEYLESIRDVEKRIEEKEKRPSPRYERKLDAKPPVRRSRTDGPGGGFLDLLGGVLP